MLYDKNYGKYFATIYDPRFKNILLNILLQITGLVLVNNRNLLKKFIRLSKGPLFYKEHIPYIFRAKNFVLVFFYFCSFTLFIHKKNNFLEYKKFLFMN